MAKIQIYGGQARTGSIILSPYPYSKDAVENCGEMSSYITDFPALNYGTDWGDWENNNTGFIGKAVSAFGGGDISGAIPKSTPGWAKNLIAAFPKFIQTMGGSEYKPPILTDSWTQLAAQLDEKASYISFKFSLLTYPVLKKGLHVEGLRYGDTLSEALNMKSKKVSNMWEWIKFSRTAVMPEDFKIDLIGKNLEATIDNLNGEKGESGKYLIEGASDVGGGLWGATFGDSTFKEGMLRTVKGAGEIISAFAFTNKRVGYTFTFQLFDARGNIVLDSSQGVPLDFYIEDIEFEFSPHIVQLINSKGKRQGVAPEWCKINLTVSSATRVTQEQFISMCR